MNFTTAASSYVPYSTTTAVPLADNVTTPQYFMIFRPSIVGVVVTSIALFLDRSRTARTTQ